MVSSSVESDSLRAICNTAEAQVTCSLKAKFSPYEKVPEKIVILIQHTCQAIHAKWEELQHLIASCNPGNLQQITTKKNNPISLRGFRVQAHSEAFNNGPHYRNNCDGMSGYSFSGHPQADGTSRWRPWGGLTWLFDTFYNPQGRTSESLFSAVLFFSFHFLFWKRPLSNTFRGDDGIPAKMVKRWERTWVKAK